MPPTHNTASSTSFHSIISNALETYEKRTKKNLLSHPLAEQLQTCNSPDAILLVLQQQVQEIHQSQSGDEMLTKYLGPTVKVLYTFTKVLGEGVGVVCFKTCFPLRYAHSCLFIWQVFSPAKAIFVGVGVLLSVCTHVPFSLRTGNSMSTSQAVRDVRASHSFIIDIFERMECFFLRLETYIEVQPTTEMRDIIIKIIVEVLSILAIATKEINQYRISGFHFKLYD